MSLINTSIQPFNTTAYHDGKFVPVSDANLMGQWSVVFFYPADFTFVCPTYWPVRLRPDVSTSLSVLKMSSLYKILAITLATVVLPVSRKISNIMQAYVSHRLSAKEE